MRTVITNIPRLGRGPSTPISMSWVTSTLPTTKNIVDAIYDPPTQRFVGFPSVIPATNSILTSSNGITWGYRNVGSSGFCNTVAHNESGTWMFSIGATVTSQYMYTSSSGQSWQLRGTGISSSVWHGVSYNNGLFYSAGYNLVCSSSNPGTGSSWVGENVSDSTDLEVVAATPTRKFASMLGGNIYVKNNDSGSWLKSWATSLGGGGARFHMKVLNGIYFMCTQGGIYTSLDLNTWTLGSGTEGTVVRRVAYGDGVYVAPLYNSNYCVVSRDALLWTRVELPVTANWRAVAYGSGTFVIMADGPTDIVAVGTLL